MAAMRAPESIDSLRARKHDIRTEAEELRMELHARRTEAVRLAIDAQSHLSRLELVAHEIGPSCLQSVMALRGLLDRHVRGWTPDSEEGVPA